MEKLPIKQVNISENIKELYSKLEQVGCRAFRNANQTIAPETWTKVGLNAITYQPPKNPFDLTNSRFLCPAPGFILVCSNILWSATVDGKGYVSAIYKNGSNVVEKDAISSISGDFGIGITDIIKVNKGDYIELYGYHYQTNNGTIYGESAGTRTFMSLRYLG